MPLLAAMEKIVILLHQQTDDSGPAKHVAHHPHWVIPPHGHKVMQRVENEVYHQTKLDDEGCRLPQPE